VIAAANIELEEAVKKGTFRKDLYYRLNIIPMALPPLRERKEDIPCLSRHFLERYSAEFRKDVKDFTDESIAKLLVYEWPGNVRELEHIVQRAVVFSKQTVILPSDILLPGKSSRPIEESFKEAKARVVEEFEREYIERFLIANKGNISKAARAAEKNRRAFWELVRKHKINVQNFTSPLL
jgi:DNA-binding NtrC family response regulator